MSDPNHQSCWCPHNCGDIDKRIDERIAKALERLAAEWGPLAARSVAAELRAAEPVSEPREKLFPQPKSCGHYGDCACEQHRMMNAPPPSLVERLREVCRCQPYEGQCVSCAAADALEAAQAWSEVATESNKAIDAYLRSLLPSLPEHYGMPVDGIRRVFKSLVEQLASAQADSRRLDALMKAARNVVASMGAPGWSATVDAIAALAATMERKP